MSDDLKQCRYCKHYVDRQCNKLSSILDVGYFMVLAIDQYISNCDLKLGAEEELPELDSDKVIGVIDSSTSIRIGKENRKTLKSLLDLVFNRYRDDCISKTVCYTDDVLCQLTREENLLRNCIEFKVEPDFYCKYWE